MMNCIDELFLWYVDQRKAFSLISSREHFQRSSPLRISDTSHAGFEPEQNLSSDFTESSCAVGITTTPRCCYRKIFLGYFLFFAQNDSMHEWICFKTDLISRSEIFGWNALISTIYLTKKVLRLVSRPTVCLEMRPNRPVDNHLPMMKDSFYNINTF